MNKNLLSSLIFVLVLVVMFWIMPSGKINDIGDFFEKILEPISLPLALLIATKLGITKYKEMMGKKDGDT